MIKYLFLLSLLLSSCRIAQKVEKEAEEADLKELECERKIHVFQRKRMPPLPPVCVPNQYAS